ncbi:MAG: transglycosylase domain-containing protein, partial [Tumebacillaceae bacterium]
NLEAAKERQKVVLDAMVRVGKLNRTLADTASAEDLKIAPLKNSAQAAPYFTDYVTYQLKNTYNVSDSEMYRGGLSVETTLDAKMQAAAEQAVADHMKSVPADSGLEVSLIAIDPQTGEIKAMVGGKNYTQSSYNRTIAKRQPGSSFKPLLYLTALNNRYTPATRIKSEPKTFNYTDLGGNEKSYEVHNFANIYANDYLTMRQGIARSDNIWAVTTAMDVGPQKVIDTARALGVTSELEPYPSLALGVFPVSPLEMVSAYAALANGGYKVEPHAIKQIKDSYTGQVQSFDPQKTSIIDAGAAYVLTDMMKSVFTDPHGTGYRVHQDLDFPVAGKSGSTDTDAWMIGYTPNLVTAVWIGYDKDQLLTPTESYLAAPIFADFMKSAHTIAPSGDFQVPNNVVEEYIDPTDGQLATENCPVKEKDYFLKGSEPTEWCTEHPSAKSTLENAEKQSESGLNSFWNWLTGKNKAK